MQATAGPFPRADAALTQPQGRPGSIVWRQLMRGACGRWKGEVLGRRGHSEAKIALAVRSAKPVGVLAPMLPPNSEYAGPQAGPN